MFQFETERSRTVSRSKSFFVRTSEVRNRLPQSVFPEKYDINSFKKRVNKLLTESHISIILASLSWNESIDHK